MPTLAIVLVLTAAVLHAGWNVLLKTSTDTLWTAVRLQVIGTVVLVPLAVVGWLAIGTPAIPAEALALAAGSGVLETVYFVALATAYRRGALSLVYPVARGSAPLIAVVIGIVLLQERLAPLAVVGVACLLAGILLVAQPWRALQVAGAHQRGAIGFALLTGASIAAYSAVDRVGVRLTEPWLYGAVLAVVASVLLTVTVVGGRRLGWLAPAPERLTAPGPPEVARLWPAGLTRDAVAGVLSLGAYLLVLFAYAIAPLATVAPLRESGIVLAAVWGLLRLGESAGAREAAVRIVAAGLVVLGAILLAVAS